jgi:hypothetical protein
MDRFQVGQKVRIPRSNGTTTIAQITKIGDHVTVEWIETNGTLMAKDFTIAEFLVMQRRFYWRWCLLLLLTLIIALFVSGVRANYFESINVSISTSFLSLKTNRGKRIVFDKRPSELAAYLNTAFFESIIDLKFCEVVLTRNRVSR